MSIRQHNNPHSTILPAWHRRGHPHERTLPPAEAGFRPPRLIVDRYRLLKTVTIHDDPNRR